jgi:hypothetical protein
LESGKERGSVMSAKGAALALCDAMGIEALCDKLIEGQPQRKIAADIGVGIATLSGWIAADLERSARAREARIASSRTFDEMAESEIRQADDPFKLSRAKELAHHLRWKASKMAPKEYGEKLEIEQRTTLMDLTEEQINARIARLTNPGE